MANLKFILGRIRGLWKRDQLLDEITEEMQFHVDQRTADNLRRGMSPEEAGRAARRNFGQIASAREEGYGVRGPGLLESLVSDLRYARRMMRRAPMFTAAVVLTVALTIAANTAIFTVVNAVLVRPLPFAEPDRLVQVAEKNDKLNLPSFGASTLNFISWREQTRTLQELGAIGFTAFTLTGAGEPEQFSGNRISPALVHVLGLRPLAGRSFTSEEEQPNAAPVAMISEALWKRRFGRDPGVIGRSVTLNGAPTTIIGIAPDALNLISGGDIYVPLVIEPAKENRLSHQILVIGRLKPGVSTQQAQSEMDAISSRIIQQYPEVRDWSIRLITLSDTFVTRELKTGLLVLLVAVGFVLLIACANIANLLLARAGARQKEIAVRKALGASRAMLVRQLLTESIVFAAVGGAAGIVGAWFAVRALEKALPPNTLPVPTLDMDPTVLLFAVGLTLTTGILFGIAPSWRIARTNVIEVLKEAGRGSAGGTGSRLRKALSAAELALATMLLIGAGLLIQSLIHLQRVHLGFDPQGLLTFQLAPPVAKYPVATKAPQLYRSLIDSLQSIPGVSGAAVSTGIPFGNGNYTTHPMLTSGQSAVPPATKIPVEWRIVSPGYFRIMGIPLLRGRDFTDADTGDSQPVTIVSEATAKKFWGDADPLGRVLRRSANPAIAFTVVGVVGSVRSTALNQEAPQMYYPLASAKVLPALPLMDVVVRTKSTPSDVLPTVRQRVHELDPELALASVRTMDDWLRNSAAQPRLNALLLGVFAGGALIIAAIGIYGVLAYSVSQRTREIGVRMAVGAGRGRVLRLILGEGMRLAALGIAIGFVAGLVLGQALNSLVYGVAVRDAATFAGVAGLLLLVALAACAVPAHRASRMDPIEALRCD